MKNFQTILIILVAMQGFLFNADIVAEGEEVPPVIINEIMWSGTSLSANDEFLELYNTTNYDIDLSEWKIKGAAASGGSLILPASSTIPALGFFVVANYLPDNDKSALAQEADFTASSISLANSDAEYQLLDPENTVIDLADDGSGAPFFGDNEIKASMARKPGCWDGGLEECWFSSEASANLKEGLPDLATPAAANGWEEPAANLEPTAIISAAATSEVNLEVLFDGQDSFDPEEKDLSFAWHLDNEEVATGEYFLKTFAAPATHEVWLTVNDGEKENSTSTQIVIFPKPEEPYQPQPNDIIINEFVSNPAEGSEWIELYNASTSTIDLGEFEIHDGKSKIFSPSGVLEPDEYYLAEPASAKLNNSGDKIYIKFGEVVINAVAYGDWEDEDMSDNEPCPGQSHALALPFGESGYQITINPTPGEKNIITPIPEPEPEEPQEPAPAPEPEESEPEAASPASSPAGDCLEASTMPAEPTPAEAPKTYLPGAIIINEFVSDPAQGGEEWVELFNPGSEKIDLKDWQLIDEKNTATSLEGAIDAGGYLVVRSPRGKLNNDKDSISLLDPTNKLISAITYGYELPSPTKGTGLARDAAGVWLLTDEPTPGRENKFNPQPEPNSNESAAEPGGEAGQTTETKKSVSSAASDNKEVYQSIGFERADLWQKGKKISLIGIVSTLPGQLAKQYFYLTDNSGRGIQVYNYKKEFPELAIGNIVYAQGELSKTNEMWRLKTKSADDIEILGNEEPLAAPISCDDADYEFYAGFVSLEGEVTEFKNSQLYLDDGTAEILVKFSKSKALENIRLTPGDQIKARGILVASKSGHYLETRLADDIEIISQKQILESDGEEKSRGYSNWAGLIPLGILMAFGIANIKKLKKLKKNKSAQ